MRKPLTGAAAGQGPFSQGVAGDGLEPSKPSRWGHRRHLLVCVLRRGPVESTAAAATTAAMASATALSDFSGDQTGSYMEGNGPSIGMFT